MSGEIYAGDVVECIDVHAERDEPMAIELRIGAVYRVEVVGVVKGEICLGLTCFPVPAKPGVFWGFRVRRFRKVIKADDAFVAQMRALRPHNAGARA